MKYLYYKLYQALKKIKTNDTPATSALAILSVVQGINVLTILIGLNHFLNVRISLDGKQSIIYFAFLSYVSLLLVNYFLFYKSRESISERYKGESKEQSIRGYIKLILYIVLSVFLVYYFGSRYPLM